MLTAPSSPSFWCSASVPQEEKQVLIHGQWHTRGWALPLRVGAGECWGQGGQVEYACPPALPSPGPWGLYLPRYKIHSTSLITSSHPMWVPPFQAQSHQVACRSFQIKPFKMR